MQVVMANPTNPQAGNSLYTYRLTHSASELSGFTCTSSLTMNSKFSIPHEANFEFIVSERV